MEKNRKEENVNQPCSKGLSPAGHSKVILPTAKAQLIFWPIMAIGIALDLWSKTAVFNWLQQQQTQSYSIIDGFLRFVVSLNDGAAFGIFPGKSYLLAVVSVIALIAIFAIFFFSGNQHTLVHVALALFAAGVCGNLYDRIFNRGFVRDFIDVVYWPGKHWPAFNLADAMLCIGVAVLFIWSFSTEKSYQTHDQQQK